MKKLLMTPGPTNVPEEVFEAMSKNMHHRTDEFSEIMVNVGDKLKKVFGSKNEVLMLLCSGTGGLEAAIVNIFSPGDKLLSINCGVFGKRFSDIARLYGVEVDEIVVEWGYGIDCEKLKNEISKKDYKAVYATYSETSTGVKNDIKSIGSIVNDSGSLFIIDAVSAIGSLEFSADEYKVDVAIAGSQKGLMCPPGLSFISISDRAWEAIENSKMPKFYFDLKKYKNFGMPYTPGVSLILGVDKSLDMLLYEGLDNVYKRHKKYSKAVKVSCEEIGLKKFTNESFESEVLTALYVPEGIDEKLLRRGMQNKGILIAGGQGKLKGKIIRIGHMGYLNDQDILATIKTLSITLNEMGYKNDSVSIIDNLNHILGV